MNSAYLLQLALGCCWLLCPEALVIAGNAAGQMGWFALPLLAVAALIFSASNRLLHNPHLPAVPGKEFVILQKSVGKIPAAGLIVASCLPLTILAATALLVTSGYTFNEVFVYWFPNFGFAFLLLALLTILQFFPERTIHRLQFSFVGLAAGGMFLLGLYGTFNTARPVSEILQQPDHFSPGSAATLLLLFAGSTFFQKKQQPIGLVPATGFVIFFFWTIASLAHVDPDRLVSSTVPYMTVSRKILGNTGRQIMGLVVISGTCAAITGLILYCRQKFSLLVSKEMAPGFLSAKVQRWAFPPVIAVMTSVLLATGLAGDELLEVYLRGALLLWLLYHSLLCLSALLWIKKDSQTIPFPASISTLLLMTGLLTLLLTSPHRMTLSTFILSVLAISGLFTALLYIVNRKQTPTRIVKTT
ncbi:MAG: hypothetical protein K9K37_12660 [Desulfocapsa sp.]|nr:hypothetical protein [Desulfocapsa sp.]